MVDQIDGRQNRLLQERPREPSVTLRLHQEVHSHIMAQLQPFHSSSPITAHSLKQPFETLAPFCHYFGITLENVMLNAFHASGRGRCKKLKGQKGRGKLLVFRDTNLLFFSLFLCIHAQNTIHYPSCPDGHYLFILNCQSSKAVLIHNKTDITNCHFYHLEIFS